MTDISMKNVRFFTFFKITMLTLPGSIALVATIISAKYGTNCLILSLFLMLCIALLYVILLYIAYTKLEKRQAKLEDKGASMPKNYIIRSIYVVRMAIRGGILLYILTEASRELVLRKYGSAAIAVPILIAAVYMGCKGFAGFIRFAEAVFWFTLLAAVAIAAVSFTNVDLSELSVCADMSACGSLVETADCVMTRGGLMFLGYFLLEFLIPVYLRVKNRKRGMIVGAVGTATVIGIIGSAVVISALGIGALASGEKNILYIVGALELPGDVRVRPLILVCYMLLVLGVMAIIPHVVCGFAAITGRDYADKPRMSGAQTGRDKADESRADEGGRDDNSEMPRFGYTKRICKALWCLAVYGVFLWLHMKMSSVDLYRLIPGYIALVDIPLSILLPAFVIIGSRAMKRAMTGAAAVLLSASLLSGCSYSAIEDVDYANVIIIQEGTDKKFQYTMMITGLDDDEDVTTEESAYIVCADTFAEACEGYNAEHDKMIETSHVEYIVAEDESILDMAYAELADEFLASYVDVVVGEDILEKAGDNNTKEYIKTHYEGRCLATWRK